MAPWRESQRVLRSVESNSNSDGFIYSPPIQISGAAGKGTVDWAPSAGQPGGFAPLYRSALLTDKLHWTKLIRGSWIAAACYALCLSDCCPGRFFSVVFRFNAGGFLRMQVRSLISLGWS
jgi:hypothetical protein